ncbi:MAG: hypothetical protein JW966_08455 [Anaerolineae bacterium]|nr:hypothetical protein [Anaerolineae bacterium]
MMSVGAYNIVLALDHVRFAAHYRDLGVSYPLALRVVTAAGWGGLFVALGIGLARRRQWARRWLLAALSNYAMFGVLWLVLFARSDFGQSRIMFQAVVSVILVLLVAWVMRWRRIRCAFEPPVPRGAGSPVEQPKIDCGEAS